MLLPDRLAPKVTAHISAEPVDLLVEVALQHRMLLEDEGDAVYLFYVRPVKPLRRKAFQSTHQEEGYPMPLADCAILELLIEDVLKQ